MRNRLTAIVLATVLLAAALLLTQARPVAVAAAGHQVVAVYRVLGQNWLVPLHPRAAWAVPLGPGTVELVPATPAPAQAMDQATRPHLYAIAGERARAFTLPGGFWSPPQEIARADLGPDPVRTALATDLDGDSHQELLLIRGEPGDYFHPAPAQGRPGLGGRLEVWRMQEATLRVWWQGLEKYFPWRLAAGDINGDGTREWAVGTWTRAVFDPRWAERPWLYRWKQGQPFALWLGSRLAHPFSNFTLAPLGPGEPAALMAVEATRQGGETLSAYRWNGFGFSLRYSGPEWERVLAFKPLPPDPGCPAVAAVVEPGPSLVLLAPDPAEPADPAGRAGGESEGVLREVSVHPLRSLAAAPRPQPSAEAPPEAAPAAAAASQRLQMAALPGHLWLLDLDQSRGRGKVMHYMTCPAAP